MKSSDKKGNESLEEKARYLAVNIGATKRVILNYNFSDRFPKPLPSPKDFN
jgi:hypothetical protein